MALNFGLNFGLNFSSGFSGDGMNPDFAQKVIVEAGSGIVPIGAIIPWAKNLLGVPALTNENSLFIECNGQVLADPDSPLDGSTIPDLNNPAAKRMLRGNTTSGTTGGSDSPSHTHTRGGAATMFGTSGSNFRITTNAASALSLYYEVVWIMRVK